jgi:hypothetical protein
MTLLITTRQTEERGNGTNRNFYFDFPVLNADELFVYILTDGDDEAVLRTDYSIAGLGNANGGFIRFTGSIPTSAQVVHLQRWVENTQETNYVENDPFPADAHEDTLDRIVMMVQQTLQFEGVGQPGAFLMWDTDGTTLINGPDYADDIANAGAHAEEATTAWLGAIDAAYAARNWAGGALNTNYTWGGLTSKSAYHWATVAMVYTVFPLNTVCWFGQLTAPIGWTTQTQFDDCLIGVRSTSAGAVYYVNTNPWTYRSPTGGGQSTWDPAAISDNGAVMLAGVYAGRLYRSNDYGATWGQVRPLGNSNAYWIAAGIDYDGSHMIAAVYSGRLYTSANNGDNWTERQPDGNANKYWRDCCIDGTGTYMYACVYQLVGVGKVWRSADGGVNWVEVKPKGNYTGDWLSIKCSRDGSRVVVCEYNGRIYTSSDYGATWAERRPAGDANYNWYNVDVSGDGSSMIAIIYNGKMYTSSNAGVSWTERNPGGLSTYTWQSCAVDYDGSHFIVAAYNGLVYQSVDSGVNWSQTTPLGYQINRYYKGLDTNEDGTRQIICIYDSSSSGYVYTYAPIAAAGATMGAWSQNTHTHTETVHTHAGGTMTVSVPAHNHLWLTGAGHTTYNVSAAEIDIYAARSGNQSTGIMVEVTKADSRNPTADLYTSNAVGAGGTASGNTANNAASNTGASATIGTWRPAAAMGIVAKLTTIPTA